MLHRHERLNFAGSVHFVTSVTRTRGPWFVNSTICSEILRIFEWYRSKYEVHCLGYVLMPDHLHALLVQPGVDESVSTLMRGFKSYTSRHCAVPAYPEPKLWRDYFDDVPVPGPDAAITKLQYIHDNPVRRRIVSAAEEYWWSSARDYAELQQGIVSLTRIDAIAGLETHNGE